MNLTVPYQKNYIMLPFKLTLDPCNDYTVYSKHRQFEAAQTAIIIDWRNRASSTY
jgi:hypothetical protein